MPAPPDSFTKEVARSLAKKVAARALDPCQVSDWIEDYAEDCKNPEEAADRILEEVTAPVILVMGS
jgi:hypothetical protein